MGRSVLTLKKVGYQIKGKKIKKASEDDFCLFCDERGHRIRDCETKKAVEKMKALDFLLLELDSNSVGKVKITSCMTRRMNHG